MAIRAPRELVEHMTHAAQAEGITPSEVWRRAAVSYLLANAARLVELAGERKPKRKQA